MKDLLFYLLFPAIVAVVSGALSFYGSYTLQKKENTSARRTLKRDFIEKMLILLDRLNIVLEKLSNDPTRQNFFSLQTIASTKPILQRIQSLTEEKLALFSDQSFRSEILNTLDEVTTIIEEMGSEEENPVRKYNEYQVIAKETAAEFSTLKIRLLEMGFYLDEQNEPQDIDASIQKDFSNFIKKNQIRLLVQNTLSKANNSQVEWSRSNEQVKEHRAFLAVKLLNAQSKVKDLIANIKQREYNKTKIEL